MNTLLQNKTASLECLLNEHFQVKVVRKDLTKLIKEGVKHRGVSTLVAEEIAN